MQFESPADLDELRDLRDQLTRFLLAYKFGIDELMTKINILKEEFAVSQDYSPIEHVNSRLKTVDSIVDKMRRKGFELSLESVRDNVTDIAGIRVTCAFIGDTYRVAEMLTAQSDITVRLVKDYIAEPKANGYRSLHLLLEIPVFLSDRVEIVPVEVQLRTIAMDFWASLEHRIYYKYDRHVPESILADLSRAAESASDLDAKMETLHLDVQNLPEQPAA